MRVLIALLVAAAFAPKAQPVAKDVWLIPGSFLPGRQPDGNTVIFKAPRGLIVMDTGRHLWQREAILDFARDQHIGVAAIVNSHWHLDHVSGNPDIRRAFPKLTVYASNAIDDALAGFLKRSATDARTYLDSGKLPPETAEDVRGDIATFENGKALRPDVVIDRSATRVVAGRSLKVNFAPNAATGGDVWVYDPATRVVATGDLVTLPAPFLDTACPSGWRKALAAIEAAPFTIAIPGHGAPMTRAEFALYRKAFDDFVDCAAGEAKDCAARWASATAALPGDHKRASGMADDYVALLRAHGGKSAECRA
jgi:glyoxylase-like metal-dependent hydrolase (beta-lactamase superfamily II)